MTIPPPGQWSPPPSPGHWGPPPPPSPNGGKTKWVLGGLGILVVVVVTAVTTLLVTRGTNTSDQHRSPTASRSSGPTATAGSSSGQQGSIITAEPTCAAWDPINNSLAAAEDNGWKQRDPSIPISAWRQDQLDQYRAVGAALLAAADQTETLAKRTPNKVVQTLYEQFVAYARLLKGNYLLPANRRSSCEDYRRTQPGDQLDLQRNSVRLCGCTRTHPAITYPRARRKLGLWN